MEEPPINYYSKNDYIYQYVDSTFAANESYCNAPANTVSCGPVLTDKPEVQKLDCLKKEYCINKKNSTNDLNRANVHLGAEGRFLDTKIKHNDLLETTVSYSIGLLGVIIFIFLHR
jgi:hypothetical protein